MSEFARRKVRYYKKSLKKAVLRLPKILINNVYFF